jgi:S-adenosylmethionine decarboxylase
MSGTPPASSYTALRQAEAISPKFLYAVDARSYGADSPAGDLAALTAVARAAVEAGGGHVLDASHVVFPNGAITLVLILAESHLSIHTWPEENLVAIDLFSCGAIDGEAVVGQLIAGLGLESATVSRLRRGLKPDKRFPGDPQ